MFVSAKPISSVRKYAIDVICSGATFNLLNYRYQYWSDFFLLKQPFSRYEFPRRFGFTCRHNNPFLHIYIFFPSAYYACVCVCFTVILSKLCYWANYSLLCYWANYSILCYWDNYSLKNYVIELIIPFSVFTIFYFL